MLKKKINCRFDVIKRNANGQISLCKASNFTQKYGSNSQPAFKKKNRSNSKFEIQSEVINGKIILDIPIQTKSEANCFEHWRIKDSRHKKQRSIIAIALKPILSLIFLPCEILFTRFAPKTLDKHDNLPMSFKYIVDAVCAIITGNFISGQADSDERITIKYDQVISKEYGIRIEISPSKDSI